MRPIQKEQSPLLKTLLKCPNKFVCGNFIQDKIPSDAKISSFAFSSGSVEFDLFENHYDISFYSNRYYIWEFWRCLINSPEYMFKTIKFFHEHLSARDIRHYRDNWITSFENPFERAALFYLLNRYSSNGTFSFSDVDKNNLSYLNFLTFEREMFNASELDLNLIDQKDFTEVFDLLAHEDVLLIPIGKQKNTFLKNKNVTSPETYFFNHNKIRDHLLSNKQRVVLAYKYSKHTDDFYKEGKTYINKLGFVTKNPELAEDLIVSNF